MTSIIPSVIFYLKKVVFKWLEEMRLSAKKINRLCVTGPRNFFKKNDDVCFAAIATKHSDFN